MLKKLALSEEKENELLGLDKPDRIWIAREGLVWVDGQFVNQYSNAGQERESEDSKNSSLPTNSS